MHVAQRCAIAQAQAECDPERKFANGGFGAVTIHPRKSVNTSVVGMDIAAHRNVRHRRARRLLVRRSGAGRTRYLLDLLSTPTVVTVKHLPTQSIIGMSSAFA